MPFDWREFLKLARSLQGRADSGYSAEASDRTAISRAYYAAFCHARNFAKENQGFAPRKTGEDHKTLREHFTRLGGEWAMVANNLDALRKWRNQCDYDDSVPNLLNQVRSAFKLADEVLAECR